MERLNADDQLMLWGDKSWPQHIGGIAILDGGGLLNNDGQLRIEAVRRAVEARLHLVPRFRQLLRTPRWGLGGPFWVDAPTVDLAEHVRVVPLPAPGDEATLLREVERLRRQGLDRSRPQWRMWFLTGLVGGRVGLFVSMHHTIADGVAGVAAVGAFLDTGPGTSGTAAAHGTPGATRTAGTAGALVPVRMPAVAHTTRDLFVDALQRQASQLGHTLSALARPADRTFALIRGEIDQVKQIAQRHGAKINDVLLDAIAGGLRGLFTSRGEPVDDLVVRVAVPRTLRPVGERATTRGNLVAQMLVPLPVGVPDPSERLVRIAAETAVRKASSRTSAGAMLRSRLARRAMLGIMKRRPVNITCANMPGPAQPLYLVGSRLLEVFPVLPITANVSLGVGALSYAGQFNITVIGDRDTYPDLAAFTSGAQSELRLLAATPPSAVQH